jgi:threonine synthase
MKYYSLNKQSASVDFKEATIRGQAPDKGLYFPERIPIADKEMLRDIENYPNEAIAFSVIRPYVEGSIPDEVLDTIVKETISFDIPLVKLSEECYSLELFHGPTLAFKDVGARFMSRCLGYFARERSEKIIVLVATSGDTGGAVANGFYNVDGVEVVILYPSGKVSSVQEKQLTAPGKNIHALEIAGTFDDCQRLVKQAFADEALNRELFLTSANSINVARWLPQQFYYFFAWKQWPEKKQLPVISVPSGNFGNICAGMLAHISGLPDAHFIAACNANDVVPEFMKTARYLPKQAVATLSNAMDVGDPSNFIRILELFHHQFGDLKKILSSFSFDDAATKSAMKEIYDRFSYLADPHGAIGYLALQEYLSGYKGQKGIFLETAHPVKFFDVVEPIINAPVPVPELVKAILGHPENSIKMNASYTDLKNYLLK